MKLTDQDIDYQHSGNISEYLRLNSEKFPDKPALLHPVRITYRELETEVNRYSFGLAKAGIKAGSLTILMVRAGPEFFKFTFALLRVGAIPVMIDPGMGINAMSKALTNVKADSFIGIPKAHLLRLFRPSVLKTVKTAIISGLPRFSGGQTFKKTQIDQGQQYPMYPAEKHNAAAIFFTSGSTGPAKGVIYTNGMLNSQIQVTKSQFNIGSDEIDLCTFPLLGLFAICHGNSSVIADMDMIHPAKLNAARIIKNIQDFSCTQMFGSPVVLGKIADFGSVNRIKLLSLRRIISAGAPVHLNVLESFSQLIDAEARIHIPYGATEALPVTDIFATERLQQGSDITENENGICIGYPVKGLDVKIIEITDNQILSMSDVVQMPLDEVGEIVVRGPWVTTEYFNSPEATGLSSISDPVDHTVWHRMGDLARIDSRGRLWFYGRKSQRVETPEGTMFTIPCEAVFNRHPLVARSALVGIPINASGLCRPVICIQPETGNHRTRKLIQELLELETNSNLTKSISDILFFDKFPVDPRHNAKIFREKLAIWAKKRIK